MKLNKEIECILRAILYPQSQICLICKDENEAEKCMDDFKRIIDNHKILKPEINENASDTKILFKNGSYINVLKKREVDNNKPTRGKRADIMPDWLMQDGYMISQEMIDEVLQPFVNTRK